jgi:hypothetical protein
MHHQYNNDRSAPPTSLTSEYPSLPPIPQRRRRDMIPPSRSDTDLALKNLNSISSTSTLSLSTSDASHGSSLTSTSTDQILLPEPLFSNQQRAQMLQNSSGSLTTLSDPMPQPLEPIAAHARPVTPTSRDNGTLTSHLESPESPEDPACTSPRRLRRVKRPWSQDLRAVREKESWEALRAAMEWGVNLYLEGKLGRPGEPET